MSYLLKIALSQYGVKEIAGENDSSQIMQYAKDLKWDWYKHDEIAWCALFINWVAWKAGYEFTNKANARSFLDIGEIVENPEIGDIIILERGNSSWQGHVGLFINFYEEQVLILGGNQSDSVNISKYNKSKILGFRKLKKRL